MKKCAIIPSYIEGNLSELFPDPENYYVICADGGYEKAKQAGIRPDLVIGDFDSYTGAPVEEEIPVMTLPTEKDYTDTGHSLSYAISEGFTDITIFGGLGGRFDHTMANVQNIAGACIQGVSVRLVSKDNIFTVIRDSEIVIPKMEGWKLSVFSLSDVCKGVTLSGVYYLLDDYTLTNTFPLGVSNEFDREEALIRVRHGVLLIVASRD